VVKPDDAKVTLAGSVPTFYEGQLAADDTEAVGGVKAIENELLVGFVCGAINDGELAIAGKRSARPRFRE
jgi:hypothetical protein